MTRHSELLEALHTLLPGATMHIAECCGWCSIILAGQRLTIIAEVDKNSAIHGFTSDLPDYEFALAAAIVADIAVVDMREIDGNVRFQIDVVMLDE